jgi:hypothetical protein
VLTVKVLVKVGLPDGGLTLHDAPEGSPVHDKPMACVEPLVKVTVILLEPELPCVTVIPPELESEKSKLLGLPAK